ncbi:hypothetical protein TNCV_1699691 [Trichonephila clavipes]|nr:hypothetical protein TNCV_1699691 [Trichonephila clavipes]
MHSSGSEGVGALEVGTGCISGLGTRISSRISETPETLLVIAGMRSNGFAFEFKVQMVNSTAHFAFKLPLDIQKKLYAMRNRWKEKRIGYGFAKEFNQNQRLVYHWP